jgi:16S rRNA pseudouridine516 synthase
MFAAIGNHVTALHRDQIGALCLPEDLEAGSLHVMTEEDVAKMFAVPAK